MERICFRNPFPLRDSQKYSDLIWHYLKEQAVADGPYLSVTLGTVKYENYGRHYLDLKFSAPAGKRWNFALCGSGVGPQKGTR